VSESCHEIPDVGLLTLHISGPSLDGFNPSILDSGLTSYPDMRVALHEALLETTKLSHDALHLLSLRKGSIIVDVEVRGTRAVVEEGLAIRSQISKEVNADLQNSLCRAVLSDASASCQVTVMHSELMPATRGTDDEALESSGSALPFIIAVVASGGVVAVSIVMCFFCRRTKLTQSWEDPIAEFSTKDVDVGPEDVVQATIAEDFKETLKNDEEISLAGSTATPTSSRHSQRDLDVISVGSGGEAISVVGSVKTTDVCNELV